MKFIPVFADAISFSNQNKNANNEKWWKIDEKKRVNKRELMYGGMLHNNHQQQTTHAKFDAATSRHTQHVFNL